MGCARTLLKGSQWGFCQPRKPARSLRPVLPSPSAGSSRGEPSWPSALVDGRVRVDGVVESAEVVLREDVLDDDEAVGVEQELVHVRDGVFGIAEKRSSARASCTSPRTRRYASSTSKRVEARKATLRRYRRRGERSGEISAAATVPWRARVPGLSTMRRSVRFAAGIAATVESRGVCLCPPVCVIS